MAGLEDGAHHRFVGPKLRGALLDAPFQRLVQLSELDLGVLGRGNIVGHPDEADVLAGRVPSRLRFRSQPAPFAVGTLVARLQHERFQRSFPRHLLLQDLRQIVRMQRLAPVEHDGLFIGKSEKIDVGLVGEGTRAVQFGDPDRDGRAVGDQPEALLAFAQRLLRQHLVGNVHVGADETNRAPVAVALDLGDVANPVRLAVVRSYDPVFR